MASLPGRFPLRCSTRTTHPQRLGRSRLWKTPSLVRLAAILHPRIPLPRARWLMRKRERVTLSFLFLLALYIRASCCHYHCALTFALTWTNFSGVHHLQEIAQAGLEIPAINQFELHPFCQQRPIVEYCKAHSIIVQAYCPLVRGQGWDNPVLKDVAEKHGKEISQILVRWSLQKGYVPSFPHVFSAQIYPCPPLKVLTPP